MSRKIIFYEKFVKRPQDFILSLSALIVLSPVLLLVATLVKSKLGSPIIFIQDRPGLNEKIFKMYKFRTMTDEIDESGESLPDSVRLTKFGKFLRSTSLDELPELWNIILGDMAIVGPRPQLIRDMVFMTQEQRYRHRILPGLTGKAQVNGRNDVSWKKKLDLDLEYLEEITFLGDWNVIFTTVSKVINREDVKAEGLDTAEDFGDYLLRSGLINDEVYKEGILCANKILLKDCKEN